MPALALDIGTYAVKAVEAEPGQDLKVSKVEEVFNSTGLSVPNDDGALEKLSTLIESVFNDYDLSRQDVRLSLPETITSTKVIEIPPLSDAELASAIGWQAEQHIPIPPEELALEYQVLFRPGKKEQVPMRVLLVGVRKKIIDRLVEMLHQSGVEPTLVETQMLSIIRSLEFQPNDPTTLLVHLGASSLDQAIVHRGELQFVTSHLNGGQMLTKTLEQTVGLDAAQAEEYKRTYGLDASQFQGKVKEALLPAVRMLLSETRKTLQFFLNQHPQEKVKRLVLSGGSAALPGLVGYMTSELGLEVLVATPFAGVEGVIPEDTNHPSFTICVGLLKRQL